MKKINFQLSTFNSQLTKGLTLVELIIVMGIMLILLTLVTPNLLGTKHSASLDQSVLTLISDLKLQQTKSMTGDTEGRGINDTYGVYFDAEQYVLFHGANYVEGHADNYAINLGDQIQFTGVLFPSSQIIFSRGSGEVAGFTAGSNTVTLQNTQTGGGKDIGI